MKVETRREFFVLRRGKGEQRAQRMGTFWPDGGEVHVKRDRHALVFQDGSFRVLRNGTYEDAVAMAHREAAVGKNKGPVTIARAVGTFGQANLYEAGLTFSPDDADGGDPILAHWRKRAEALGKSAEDIRYRTGMFGVATDGKAPGKAKGLVIEGLASTPDVDRDEEVVLPSAFDETLTRFLDNPVMLFMHNHFVPIGFWTEIATSEEGVHVKGEVVDEQIRDWIENRGLKMLSIGFIPMDGDFKETPDGGVWVINKAELLEVSVVTIPANPFARFAVAKAAKLKAPENEAANCCHGELMCTCPARPGVIEYRSFPVADLGSRWEPDQAATRKAVGQEALDLCHTWDGEESDPHLQHSALVGDDLATVPELVRCAMAEVIAYHGDWTPEDRNAIWATLGKRWMDCFADEPVPTIDKLPAPGLFKATVERKGDIRVKAVRVSCDAFEGEIEARKWVRDHGFAEHAVATSDKTWTFAQRKGEDGWSDREVRFDAGVIGVLSVKAVDADEDQEDEGGEEITMKQSDVQRMIDEAVKNATATKEEVETTESEEAQQDAGSPQSPAGQAGSDEEMVEVDEDVAAALDEIHEALNSDDEEIEIGDSAEFQRVTAAAAESLGVELDEVEVEDEE